MKIISNINKYKNKIKKSIRKFGYCAEHNYMHYHSMENSKEKNIVFDFGKDRLALANYDDKNRWELFPSGILAPEHERYIFLEKSLKYILNKKKAEKIVVEVDEPFRKEILKKFKANKNFKARSPFILYWPIYKLSDWDPKLKGKKWKKLRNIKNRFFKKNKVKVVNSNSVDKEILREIVSSWLKRRRNNDLVNKDYYFNIIDNKFKGFDFSRTMIVNGNPCSITAGWKIPNSQGYYSSVGIFDYSCKYLGDIANMDDLNNLKRNKIKFGDFGGSDKALLSFKKKFKPESIYKTYIFSIVRA